MKKCHAKYYNTKKEEIPSVTTILSIINKPELLKWANYIGFKHQNVSEVQEIATNIGTKAHKLIENKLNNILEPFMYVCNVEDKNAITSYKNFLIWNKDNPINVINTEIKIEGDDFGGTVDLYCNKNGKYEIIDFKTSNKIYPTMFLQLAGYTLLLESQNKQIDCASILRIDKKYLNKYEYITIYRADLNKYIKVFIALKDFYNLWINCK